MHLATRNCCESDCFRERREGEREKKDAAIRAFLSASRPSMELSPEGVEDESDFEDVSARLE